MRPDPRPRSAADSPRWQKAVEHLLHVPHTRLEGTHNLPAMRLQSHAQEGGERKAIKGLIDDGGIALNHTAAFQVPDPSQTWRRGQVHPFRQLLVGQSAILLQQSDDLTVLRIHYPASYWQILPNSCDFWLNFATRAHPDHAILGQRNDRDR